MIAKLKTETSAARPARSSLLALSGLVGGSLIALACTLGAGAQAQTPIPPVSNPCPRFTAGSVIHNPPALYSQNGVLNVRFSYQTTTDSAGRQLYCFMTPDGLENPTLHLNPGDTLNVTVTNNTPSTDLAHQTNESDEHFDPPNCGDTTFELESVAPNTIAPGKHFAERFQRWDKEDIG